MKKILIRFCMFLLIINIAYSEVLISSNNKSPSLNESFSLSISFINDDKDDYTIKGLDNFHILSKGTNNSYSLINGDMTSKKSDNYTLKPKKIGEFIIEAIGKKGEKESLKIYVSNSKKYEQELSKKYILEGILPNKEYYFGEKIPYEEYFITTRNIAGLSKVSGPDFKDFSVKNITPNDRGNYVQSVVDYNGQQALKITTFEGILESNLNEKNTIKTSEFKVGEVTNDPFYTPSVFVGGKELPITIKPLPEKGKPSNFSNIVGNIQDSVNWKDDKGEVGKAITLDLNIYGEGNLELLDTLPIESNSSFNIFQNAGEYKEEIHNGKYYNEKNYEIALVPKIDGELETPEIKIPYFDTKNGDYKYLVIPSKKIKVIGDGNNIQNNKPTSNSPIDNIKDKKIEIKKEIVPKENKIIEISQLEMTTESIRNPYKLLSLILGVFILIQSIFLGYIIKKNKK